MDWNQFERGVYLVNCLGIIYDPKKDKILLGKRQNDPYLQQLSWCFPGGRPKYHEELEEGLTREIKVKTGLEVDVKELVFAKSYPEKRELLSLYYFCEVTGGSEKAGELFVELAWIHPKEIDQYFTTSLHPIVKKYLDALHKKE